MITLGAPEAVIVPVAILVMQFLSVSTNGLSALGTGVSTDFVETLDTAVVALLLNILLAMQRVSAVVAVELFSHCACSVPTGPSRIDWKWAVSVDVDVTCTVLGQSSGTPEAAAGERALTLERC